MHIIKNRILFSTIILAGLWFVFLSMPCEASLHPWFIDVDEQHWAYRNIRVMWEEGNVDGFYIDIHNPAKGIMFRPDRNITKAEFGLLLYRTFALDPYRPLSPTFLDVPFDYIIYGYVDGFEIIEALDTMGMIPHNSVFFFPESYLTREQAGEWLVDVLNLRAHAASLTKEQVDELLSVFHDESEIAPHLRNVIATCVQLRILTGYGTTHRTIQPRRQITRDEAVSIVYRSCFIRVFSNPDYISPDSDGFNDFVTFYLSKLKNRNTHNKQLHIKSSNDNIVNTIMFNDHEDSVIWMGNDTAGLILPPGQYFYFASAQDRHGNYFVTNPMSIWLILPSITATITPSISTPGGSVHVNASTHGHAERVDLLLPDGRIVNMNKVSSSSQGMEANWVGTFVIDKHEHDGEYELTARAYFKDSIIRDTVLSYRVEDYLFLKGMAIPNSLKSGQIVTIIASASENILNVGILLPCGLRDLMLPIEGSHWRYEYRVPIDTPNATYQATLKGISETKTIHTTVHYEVIDTILANIKFYLSD